MWSVWQGGYRAICQCSPKRSSKHVVIMLGVGRGNKPASHAALKRQAVYKL